jgi:hypothetical protein
MHAAPSAFRSCFQALPKLCRKLRRFSKVLKAPRLEQPDTPRLAARRYRFVPNRVLQSVIGGADRYVATAAGACVRTSCLGVSCKSTIQRRNSFPYRLPELYTFGNGAAGSFLWAKLLVSQPRMRLCGEATLRRAHSAGGMAAWRDRNFVHSGPNAVKSRVPAGAEARRTRSTIPGNRLSGVIDRTTKRPALSSGAAEPVEYLE